MILVMEQLFYEKTLKRPQVFNLEKKRMMEGEIKIYKRIKAVDEELLPYHHTSYHHMGAREQPSKLLRNSF